MIKKEKPYIDPFSVKPGEKEVTKEEEIEEVEVEEIRPEPVEIGETQLKRKTDGPIRRLHPELADMYEELNGVTELMYRTRDFRVVGPIKQDRIRRHISDYKKSHGITREDEIRWFKED